MFAFALTLFVAGTWTAIDHSLPRGASIAMNAVASFVMFALEKANASSTAQQNKIVSIDRPDPTPQAERIRARKHTKVRELIDDANDVLTKPFDGITTSNDPESSAATQPRQRSSDSPWTSESIPAASCGSAIVMLNASPPYGRSSTVTPSARAYPTRTACPCVIIGTVAAAPFARRKAPGLVRLLSNRAVQFPLK